MLEDRDRGVIYVPFSVGLVDEMKEWSEPVQFRLERDAKGELGLVFRKVEWRPIELSKGRSA
jgi:hypothetical protein